MSMKKKPESNRSALEPASICLVLLSDTHQLHRELEIPDGDVLIHAGDFTLFSKSLQAIDDFNAWLGKLPHRHKIVVPGNHEFFLEEDRRRCSLLSHARVLINEGIEIEGLRIWGSPVTPLYGGAFGMSSAADRMRLYAGIPEDVDVLVTHGPPHGILDRGRESEMHSGCAELRNAVLRTRPKLHVFGHVHGGYGVLRGEHTMFVNAALFGASGGLDHAPIVLRMSRT